MNKIVDLSVLVRESLIFRDATGEEYTIPGEVDLNFVIKLNAYFEQVEKIKNEAAAIIKAQELVVDILNLDKTKNITLDFVKERFNDVRLIRAIIENMINFINEIASDPNSDSPA